MSGVDGNLVAELESLLRLEETQHSTLARRSSRQEGREARPAQVAGHASGQLCCTTVAKGQSGVWPRVTL